MSKEAMKLALEALELCNGAETAEGVVVYTDKEITALREALAEQPAPVAEPWLLEATQTLAKNLARKFYPEVTQWECLNDLAGVISQIDNMTTGLVRKPAQQEPVGEVSGHDWSTGLLYRDLEPGAPLYTTPQPAQRTWVGLTDEEIDELRSGYQSGRIGSFVALARAIEAKLKEKNT